MGYRVNILINNAGVAGTVDFASSPVEYSDERILVNARALVLITRLFLPELKTHSRAHILNVGSLSAYYPLPYKSVYAASKAFVHSFTRGLHRELRGGPVQLTVVHPNGVRTNADTFERIDSHSRVSRLLFILDMEEIARIAVNSMLKGKLEVIPGFMNRVLILISGLLPKAFKERRSARIFGKEILED
jgi:short-subunit dehydrogenase